MSNDATCGNLFHGDEVVITGISGVFPDSYDVYHFRDNLFNKVDMVSGDNRRWLPIYSEIPHRTGKLFDIEKFDLGYFGITSVQSDNMDPLIRIMLEKSMEAIMDAGHHPSDFADSNTAVCVGTCSSETEKSLFYHHRAQGGDAFIGTERSMVARRLSYFLGLKGRNLIADTACSSSVYAIENGYNLLREGKCNKVLVCGANLCLHPFVSLQFKRLGVLSADGSCKSFDDAGDGYTRSEAIAVLLLEKAKDAKRIYAEIVHAQTNCDGYKKEGITFPSSEIQKRLLQDFYNKCKVDPSTVSYVEAHGTGTKVGDPTEIQTLDQIFCTKRNTPLHIGTVKSNIGHCEPASAVTSVVKVILAMETGYLPPNLHYKKPRRNCEALTKGRMIVVTEKMPLPDNRGLFGVNNFGFGGANGHVLLRWNPKTKINEGLPTDDLPRLICVSARIKEGIDAILEDYKSKGLDMEYTYLIQEVFRKPVENHNYRGFGIYTKYTEIKRSQKRINMDIPKLYFIFSNFDKEWLKVGSRLMTIPIFAETIKSIHDILLRKTNVNLVRIIKNCEDEDKLGQILGTVAIQISLANLLKAINLTPYKIIGIGSGELSAAYANTYLDLKQTILGLFYIASNTIEGKNLNLGILEDVLPSNKNNYKKWIPNDEPKNISKARNGQNMQRVIPKDVLSLAIGPNIKQMTESSLQLVDATSTNIIVDMLTTLGGLYEDGFDFELSKFYPHVSLPLSRSTPMLSPLIRWNHKKDCKIHLYKHEEQLMSGHKIMHVNPKTEDWSFVLGHVLDGRNLFPATGYLLLILESLSNLTGRIISEMRIVFEDVQFVRATNVPKDGSLELLVMIQIGTGQFEISEQGAVVVTGKLFDMTDEHDIVDTKAVVFHENETHLTGDDIYKKLRLRGYQYSGKFKGIRKCNIKVSKAIFQWEGNWVSYMDYIIQLHLLHLNTTNLYVPINIPQLIFDAPRHIKATIKYSNMIPAEICQETGVIRTGGIEVKDLRCSAISRKKDNGPILETYKFFPNKTSCEIQDSLRVLTQFIVENSTTTNIKVIEVAVECNSADRSLCPIIQRLLEDLPSIQQDLIILTKQSLEISKVSVQNKPLDMDSKCLLLILSNVSETTEITIALNAIRDANGFILSRESTKVNLSKFHNGPLQILCCYKTNQETLVLLKPFVEGTRDKIYLDISNSLEDFEWLPKLQKIFIEEKEVVIYSQNNNISGVLGLVNCLKEESFGSKITMMLIMDKAPKFDPNSEFYKKQLEKNLRVNVWKNGSWGTYRHLLLPETQIVKKEHCCVNVTTRGDLSTLTWSEGKLNRDNIIPNESELVHIYYASLNFRDLMTASGKLELDGITKNGIDQECVQGIEFSGRDSKGRRVMGTCEGGSLASLIVCNKQCLYPIPENWSMEDAATVLIVYGTVLHGLLTNGCPKPGQSILIHSGAGGIGLAAINLSVYFGFNIFVTVGTKKKRNFIISNFPKIKEEHIGNSRDASFELMVKKYTNNQGVDYVLNSLTGDKLLASVRCLAKRGKFIELGKFDLTNNNSIVLHLLEKECDFIGVGIDKYLEHANTDKKKLYSNRIIHLLKQGAIKPLPRTVFEYNKIEEAFRYMSTGRHIGKILMNIRNEEPQAIYDVPKLLFEGVPRFYCDPNCSYVILGGLGGFGLELAGFFVTRGARKLVLTSKSGVCTGYQIHKINFWKNHGVTLLTSVDDASTEAGCINLLEKAINLGPVDGIFNLAAVLSDGLFENLTVDDFKTSFSPKALATKYLDIVSRKLCPNLRYFVIFSSIASGRGNTGQTNYGMANSIMERICENRKCDGYPATAIQWGAVGDVGMVTRMKENEKEVVIGGTVQQKIFSCLDVLDKLLTQDQPVVSSMVVAEKTHGTNGSNLFETVLNIIGVRNLQAISMHSTFPELGMDSMMAVEIKQTLEREFEIFLAAQDIRNMTLAKLKDFSKDEQHADAPIEQEISSDLQLFLQQIGREEHADIPIIDFGNLVETHKSTTHIIALPGVEGMAGILEPLCKKLKAQVSCLQFRNNNNMVESIDELANSLLPYLESANENIIILAYSYGTIVATELLYLMESRGRYIKNVIFIDGAPDFVVKLTKARYPKEEEEACQTSLICSFMMRFMSYNYVIKHTENVTKCKTFQEKTNYLTSVLPKMDASEKHIADICLSVYNRISSVYKYESKAQKLKSNVTLFKPTIKSLTAISSDYELSKIFQGYINVVNVQGNHSTILENDDLAKHINKILTEI